MSYRKKERTVVIIKPDGVQRSLIGEVIHRYERMGLKLVGIKMVTPTAEQIEKHYLVNPDWKINVGTKTIENYNKKGETPPSTDPLVVGENVLKMLKHYMTMGPVISMVWEGANAVEVVRKVTGSTEPRSSDVGTIRGDFMLDSYPIADLDVRALRNIAHISGNVSEATKELPIWFKPEEIIEYRHVQEKILYDADMGGILDK